MIDKVVPEKNKDVPELDLDFHVEFPTPGVVEHEVIWPCETKDGGLGQGDKEEKQVLVILLGWAGSQDKYLSKYSDFYLKRGCIILRYITPVQILFLDTAKLPLLAKRFVGLLRDLQLNSHPTFFHVFSNGGSFLYSNILKELGGLDDPSEFNFRGTIFDSAPSPRNLRTCFRAMTNIFANMRILRYIMAAGVVLCLTALTFWHHLKLSFQFCFRGEPLKTANAVTCSPTSEPLGDWLTRIRQVQKHAFAFLYSDQDDLIASNLVEDTADVLKKRGNLVTKVKFDGSAHVMHYRQFPQEYIGAVTKFIRTVMSQEYVPTVFWDEAN